MRILYLHQYYNTPDMQGGTRSYEFSSRLCENGHKVIILTANRDPNSNSGWTVTKDRNLEVHWYRQPYSNNFSFNERVKAFLGFAIAAAWRCRKIDCDLVFATSTPLLIAIPGIFKSLFSSVPLVFEVRDLWPEMPIAVGALRNRLLIKLARLLESIAYSRSVAVVALSPGMKKGVIRAGYSSERLCVIPNACDMRLFSNLSDANQITEMMRPIGDKKYMLYAGTLGKINGVGYLVDLARCLLDCNSNLSIVVVGDGSELEQVRSQALGQGVLDNNFFLIKGLPKKEVVRVFKMATICSSVFLDIKEMQSNSSNKFFDGLAAGKPMFVNYGGWHANLITEHRCGLVGWRKDLNKVAIELDLLVNDQESLRDAGSNSSKLAASMFNRDLLFDDFEQVLKLALNGQGESVSSVNDL